MVMIISNRTQIRLTQILLYDNIHTVGQAIKEKEWHIMNMELDENTYSRTIDKQNRIRLIDKMLEDLHLSNGDKVNVRMLKWGCMIVWPTQESLKPCGLFERTMIDLITTINQLDIGDRICLFSLAQRLADDSKKRGD